MSETHVGVSGSAGDGDGNGVAISEVVVAVGGDSVEPTPVVPHAARASARISAVSFAGETVGSLDMARAPGAACATTRIF